MSRDRATRIVRLAAAGGMLAVASVAMSAPAGLAQTPSDQPSDQPSDEPTTTTVVEDTTTTTVSSDLGGSTLALTGGNSEAMMLSGLGLGTAALAVRRRARRA